MLKRRDAPKQWGKVSAAKAPNWLCNRFQRLRQRLFSIGSKSFYASSGLQVWGRLKRPGFYTDPRVVFSAEACP